MGLLRPHAAGLVPLLVLLLLAVDTCCNAQPSSTRRPPPGGKPKKGHADKYGGGRDYDDPRHYHGDYHYGGYGYKHKDPKPVDPPAPRLSNDVAFTVDACTVGLPGTPALTNKPPVQGVPYTASVSAWFKLQCTQDPLLTQAGPAGRGARGGGARGGGGGGDGYYYDRYDGGYDRYDDRYDGYDGYYDRGYDRNYNQHPPSAYNYTRPYHKDDGYHGHNQGRRLQQAQVLVDAGECWLWGITDRGIDFDANSSSSYSASASFTCWLGNDPDLKTCDAQFGGAATASASNLNPSFSGQGRVQVNYIYSDVNGKVTRSLGVSLNDPDQKLLITAFYNGAAQAGTTTITTLPMLRYNTGIATLKLDACASTLPVASDVAEPAPVTGLKQNAQGGGKMVVTFTI